ncbi:MAG: hypothetical protein M5U12_00085 [Verrucomicrobia bacterium]|nr:hypothetical protein [Verrucomicrobiota bacterium]
MDIPDLHRGAAKLAPHLERYFRLRLGQVQALLNVRQANSPLQDAPCRIP